jgi:hypothetical protein
MFLIWQGFEDFWTKNISLSRRSFHQTKWDHLSSIKRYLRPTFRRLVSKVNNIFGKKNRGKTEYVDVQGLS